MKTFLQKLKKILPAGRRGFTIFFAVLVASLALSVGLVIYDLLIRSLTLSQVATQSQYAIYAADTGAECALYWDFKYIDASSNNNGGSGSAFSTSTLDVWPVSGVVCNTQDIAAQGTPPVPFALPPTGWTAWSKIADPSLATTTFTIALGSSAIGPCVRVEVGKSGNPSQTTIVSHGYNTCAANSPLRLERTLQVNY